ncbi:hypothetical protein [Nocardia sp. NBC_00881]|uniref:hypothetical protein n=1 Tax=Nocardia sp. NBC_00881 TaxID=2975995 RepID=UPI00386373FD
MVEVGLRKIFDLWTVHCHSCFISPMVGIWTLILKMLQAVADAAGAIVSVVSGDSTIARAHRHAAGARRDGAGQAEPPGGVEVEPTTTPWVVLGAAGPRRPIWPPSRAARPCRS